MVLQVPEQRTHLAVGLPTPIHPWHVPGLPEGVDLWIKRDDLTGTLFLSTMSLAGAYLAQAQQGLFISAAMAAIFVCMSSASAVRCMAMHTD